MSVAQVPVQDEHELYPVHEEENVPINAAHDQQTRLLASVLEARFPQHWVASDVCMYWEPGNFSLYRAPDVFVVQGSPEDPLPGVFLNWSDGPAFLAIEVGSKSTFRADEGPKVEDYLLKLGIPEYLYYWPSRLPRHRKGKLWRLVEGSVVEVEQNAAGRWESQSLGIEFGIAENGRLRAYEPDGRLIPGPKEWLEQSAAGERKAAVEHLRAEQERFRAEEAELRAEQERQRAEEERQRAEEERQRAEQERQRSSELEQELARLREQLRNVRGGDS